ncbi:MAG TPA: macro domain-containing protein [Candidatus Nanoarchaeia archaeon]|nr:macro domain-containing protein [Candidatus Nanoarchaeia archaeon]
MVNITVRKGSITTLDVDAIVNPANSYGEMGGGVAWVIKNVGGAVIEEEAMTQARFHIGAAVLTTGGELVARHVIHTPTMEEPAEKTNLFNIQQAVEAALELAEKEEFTKIAFPGMGTGVGGVDKKEAAKTMVGAIRNFPLNSVKEVVLVGKEDEMVKAFQKALDP